MSRRESIQPRDCTPPAGGMYSGGERSESSLVLESVDVSGRGLRVEFRKQGDRHAHTIAAVDGEIVSPLLESVEGDDVSAWPPSPPLQVVTLQPGALLGVGMAGSSHWSLSVERQADPPALIFDVACRAAGKPQRLGSQYRCAAQATLDHDSQSALIQVESRKFRLTTIGPAGAAAARISASGDLLAIDAPPDANAATLRWMHRIERLQ